MQAPPAILIAAGLATFGWLYAARRARALSRKQHTVNIMLQASLNKEFRETSNELAPHLRQKALPNLEDNINRKLLEAVRMIANHYEFMAAGVRNGDFDERLLIDSERGTMVMLFLGIEDHIKRLRTSRNRPAIYEHLEWLYNRWEKAPPGRLQRIGEWCIARPLSGKRSG